MWGARSALVTSVSEGWAFVWPFIRLPSHARCLKTVIIYHLSWLCGSMGLGVWGRIWGLNASGTTTVALSHGWQLALAVAGSPFEAADQSTSGHLPAALVFREEFSHCGRWAPTGRKHNCPFKGCAFAQKDTSSASPSQNASQGSVNLKSEDRDWREKWHRVCGCLLPTTSGLPGPLPHLVLSCSAAGCISPHLG